jgi:predicted RNA binding protein YcfA (HicA-like mRNA interferase family)
MPISGKEMLKKYKEAGWKLARRGKNHYIVKKEERTVSIPDHKELKKGIEKKLLKWLKEG